ncbi:cysteine desulfurase [Candidatus Kaiserbacteria bacterium]|nr:cysteine desulfurase [Candidatus Kaiserbacteria bacterium]
MFSRNKQKRPIYLDWAAATSLLPEAKAAMEPWLTDNFANPSAIHAEGQVARGAVEAARGRIAAALQVRPEFVTFTGSGTEANNLAILGTIEARRQSGVAYSDMEVISTAIEHPSVSKTLAYAASLGVVVKIVPVKESGVINVEALRTLVTNKTVLLSTHYVNSEIGTIQPTRVIKKVLKEAAPEAVLHIDAAQAPLWLSCQFDTVAADILTLDVGKCCGPKGVGLLVRSKGIQLKPVFFGGGQEAGLRPGTENVAGVVGAAEAFAWAQSGWRERAENVAVVRNQAIAHLLQEIPQALLNGAMLESDDRVANNINISIPGLDTEFATVVLDSKGFAVSTKSACSGAGGGESAVVKATTQDPARAASTLRITLGPDTTVEQLKQLTTVLKHHVAKLLP